MLRYATSNTYVAELASLPYLYYPDVTYKLPVYKHQIEQLLRGIPEQEIEYVNKLCDFCINEGGESIEEYIKIFNRIMKNIRSKVFYVLICQIFSLKMTFRMIAAEHAGMNINNEKINNYLNAYPEILKAIKNYRTFIFYRKIKSLIANNEYYQSYLLMLKNIWRILEPYHCRHLFNLEGLFMYKLKWRFLESWMKIHDPKIIADKINKLVVKDDIDELAVAGDENNLVEDDVGVDNVTR